MFVSALLAGILAGEPVPVLRSHGTPKKKIDVAAKQGGDAAASKPPIDPTAYDYYPENQGIKLYDVVDAKGKFGFEIGYDNLPSYCWEGLVPVYDTHRKTRQNCHFCIKMHKYEAGWFSPSAVLMVKWSGTVWYNSGNFVLSGKDSEWSRSYLKPFNDHYNGGTMKVVSLSASMEKISWLIHAEEFHIRYGNLIVELPEESIAQVRIMARACLDFAEGREEKGRQRLDEQIRLQDAPPKEAD